MDLTILSIDTTAAILLVGAVAGFVEFVKALFDKDWRRGIIISGSALVGGLASLLLPIDVITGIVGGLAASGCITIGQNVGKDSL